jgi:transposase
MFALTFCSHLSRKVWLVTSLSPGAGEKMSKHSVSAGDVAALLLRFAELKRKVQARTGECFSIVAIQEAGLDGFCLHRLLESERRRRNAKTDRLDGEALLRALLAFKRGEPRVCAMAIPPTPEEEDRRRLSREGRTLVAERVEHVNRIKGLLFSQGISDYEPIERDRRKRLDELRTGDGRPIPIHLRSAIARELDRLELLIDQIKAVEAERDKLLAKPRADAIPSSGRLGGVHSHPCLGTIPLRETLRTSFTPSPCFAASPSPEIRILDLHLFFHSTAPVDTAPALRDNPSRP